MAEPLDLPVLEDEVEEDHQQEHAAEGGDRRVGVGHQLLVLVLVVEREPYRFDRTDLGADGDDHDREDQAHAEDRDQDADGEEDLLPEGIHLLQDPGVDHGVVEGNRYLEDGQDRHDPEAGPPAVEHRGDQAERGDRERPAERFQKYWLPNRFVRVSPALYLA